MIVYRFKPNRRDDHRVALSNDETGESLPADGAPWHPIGEIDLQASNPWIKVPVPDIEAAISKSGSFIWGISVPVLKSRFQK